MDLFDFSIKMEKDAEALYRKMADNAPIEGIKRVLLLLAEDEVRHREAIERLRQNMDIDPPRESVLEIKTVFEELKEDPEVTSISTDTIEDYQKAVEIEKKGVEFYKEQFAGAEDETSKRLFDTLMRQEIYHLHTTQNLLDMVQRPAWWVEDAEFNPHDSNVY